MEAYRSSSSLGTLLERNIPRPWPPVAACADISAISGDGLLSIAFSVNLFSPGVDAFTRNTYTRISTVCVRDKRYQLH